MNNTIEIKNLKKKYKNYSNKIDNFTLEDINLDIKTGTIVGLVGKNGAGKTTLLKTILNILKSNEGEIKVFGIDNKSKEFYEAKENIGVVFDEIGIYDSFDITDVNNLMGYAYKNWSSERFINLTKQMDIYTDKKIKDFSTGMKKKLSLSVALGHNPDLLLLDEPTANLDPFARDEIIDYIYEYTRDENKTVLISSHILSDLEKICDYIVYIENGKITLYEEKDMLMENYAIIKVTNEEYESIPKDIIIYEDSNHYGYELLVKGDKIPEGIRREFASLDEIVVKLMKSKRK